MTSTSLRALIFLDVDGVLNHKKWFKSQIPKRGRTEMEYYGSLIDPVAVKNLNWLVQESDAEIVVSSTWRLRHMDKLPHLLNERGLEDRVVGPTTQAVIIDRTPDIYVDDTPWIRKPEDRPRNYTRFVFERGMEIEHWLRHNRLEQLDEQRLIIIDDGGDFSRLSPWHIKTSFYKGGLHRCTAEKALRRLQRARPVGEVLSKPHKMLTCEGRVEFLYT